MMFLTCQPLFRAAALIGLLSLAILLPAASPATTILKTPEQTPPPPKFTRPPVSARSHLPGRREAAGGRSNGCHSASAQLISLTPAEHLSITAALHPQLLFYISEIGEQRTVEWVLRDSNDQEVHSRQMLLPAQAGWVRIDFAHFERPVTLQTDQDYRWYFSIICPDNRAADFGVEGWIRRVDQKPLAPPGQLSSLEQVKMLLELGLWHDVAMGLAEIQATHPQNNPFHQQAQEYWQQLLLPDPSLRQLVSIPLKPLQRIDK